MEKEGQKLNMSFLNSKHFFCAFLKLLFPKLNSTRISLEETNADSHSFFLILVYSMNELKKFIEKKIKI